MSEQDVTGVFERSMNARLGAIGRKEGEEERECVCVSVEIWWVRPSVHVYGGAWTIGFQDMVVIDEEMRQRWQKDRPAGRRLRRHRNMGRVDGVG